MEGIQKAKQRGVAFGRQKKLSDQQIQDLKDKRGQGTLIKDLMKEYGLSKATVYRYLGDAQTELVEVSSNAVGLELKRKADYES